MQHDLGHSLTLFSDKPSGVEGFPLRRWSMELFMLSETGDEIPASVYSKATYHLHESFGKRATQGKSGTTSPWGDLECIV